MSSKPVADERSKRPSKTLEENVRLHASGSRMLASRAVSLFIQAGGEDVIRPMVARFYDAVFADVMIGFFFQGANKARLIEKEYELIAEILGGPVQYSGRPLRAAHAAHPIMNGHFFRRLQLLKDSMLEAGLPQAAIDAVVTHNLDQQLEITGSKPCD